MSTAPRKHEVGRERETDPRAVLAPTASPGLRHLSPATILALQRTAGNQAVARRVGTELRSAPRRPKPPPASAQASPENRELAADIDHVDTLDDAAFDQRRAENATRVAETEGAAHAGAVRRQHAIEYVATRRGQQGPKPDVKQWRSVRNDQTRRRQFLNALVAERAHEDGSFETAMQGIMFPDPLIEGDLAVIRADADRFRSEFRAQARINAERMLRNSNQAIAQLLTSYGIPAGSATIAAERILKGGGVAEEAAAVIRSMKRTADEPGGANQAAPTRHRMRLAQWVERVKTHQARVREAAKASNLADMNVSVASTPADQVARKARATLRRERDTLAGLWIQAERLHPVLAAHRSGGPLEKIELGALDSADADVEMQTVLERVLPKVVSIARANALIRNGTVSPLSLTPVVAMTRANMFVPPGSVRAAIVRDLLRDAEEGESGLVMLLSFALALVTLVPSGGASLGVAAGAASAGLAAYSALQEFQTYEHNKTLIDTDLDRARALSDEEPSLAAFAVTLVGLGLEGALLVHAFKTAVQLRRIAMAGDESKRLQELLDELNKIGQKNNAPDLGKQVLDDAKPAAPPKPGEPSKPAGPFSDAEVTQDMPVVNAPPGRRPPAPYTEKVPQYRNREEVRAKVTGALKKNLNWGDGKTLSEEYKLLGKALEATPGPANAKIAEALPHVAKGLRDPDLYGEVMADAWALAKSSPDLHISAALEEMARSGGAPIRYIELEEGLLPAPVFFERYASKPGHIVDMALLGDAHLTMTHLIQDLVVDRALRRAGQNLTSVEFRGLLGQAEGTVAEATYVTKSTKTFEDNEREMRTGDYIWRMLFDNTGMKEINRPESIGLELMLALGIR